MADEKKKTYEDGLADGVKLWGEACSRMGNCGDCPLGDLRGDKTTCAEFCKQFPKKSVSALKSALDADYTYYDEYLTRFPNCDTDVETLANNVCRQFVFGGFANFTCDKDVVENPSLCVDCWLHKYEMDVEPTETEESF